MRKEYACTQEVCQQAEEDLVECKRQEEMQLETTTKEERREQQACRLHFTPSKITYSFLPSKLNTQNIKIDFC